MTTLHDRDIVQINAITLIDMIKNAFSNEKEILFELFPAF